VSRRSKRWDTWVNRQYREHDRWYRDCNGRHSRWWELGQDALGWESYARAQGVDPTDKEAMAAMQDEMPF
jgi:hypothetical protein